MAAEHGSLQDWLRLIRAEYEELPDAQLTQSEVEQMWGLDTTIASALLDALVLARVLKKNQAGAYVRGDTAA